jgi:hypothetical protein
MNQFDRSKSLQQLDGQEWGEPTFDSHLVNECHRLRRVPLREVSGVALLCNRAFWLPHAAPASLHCV